MAFQLGGFSGDEQKYFWEITVPPDDQTVLMSDGFFDTEEQAVIHGWTIFSGIWPKVYARPCTAMPRNKRLRVVDMPVERIFQLMRNRRCRFCREHTLQGTPVTGGFITYQRCHSYL